MRGFFLPKRVLSEVFRGKFTDALRGLFRRKKLAFHGSLACLAEARSFARFLHDLHRHEWVVDVRKPFGDPSTCCTIWRVTRIGSPSRITV
jgi:hypothetical protein